MHRILLGLFLLQPLVVVAEPSTHLTRELERLTKVLPPAVLKSPEQFYGRFHNDAGRLNVSIEKYADTCFDSYLAMQLSPGGVWDEVTAAINRNNGVVENWKDTLPLTHSALVFRRRAIERMAANALLPETADFVNAVASAIEPTFQEFILGETQRRKILKSVITKIALSYKKLSVDSRKDLERALCFGNTMRWVAASAGSREAQLFDRFWEVVGVNVDGLLRTSEVYSTVGIDHLKDIIKIRAKTLSVLPPNNGDTFLYKMTANELMGSTFGQNQLNSTEELFERMFNESAPFMSFISKRKSFVEEKLNHLTPKTREKMEKMKTDLSLALLQENNKMATNQTHGFREALAEDNSLINETFVMWELERVFCAGMLVETMKAEPPRTFARNARIRGLFVRAP